MNHDHHLVERQRKIMFCLYDDTSWVIWEPNECKSRCHDMNQANTAPNIKKFPSLSRKILISIVLIIIHVVTTALCDLSLNTANRTSDYRFSDGEDFFHQQDQGNFVQNEPDTSLYQVESEQYTEEKTNSISNSLVTSNDVAVGFDGPLKYPCTIESKEALSAVERATTWSCKQELVKISCKLQSFNNNNNRQFQSNFRNYCPNDLVHKKYEHLGCHRLQNGEIQQKFVFLQTQLPQMKCIEGCYKYGYELAAIENKTNCLCSTHLEWLESLSANFYKNLTTTCEIDSCNGNACTTERALDVYATSSSTNSKFKLAKHPMDPSNIRIVFLFTLNGRAIRQVRRLIRNLYSRRHTFYIHVDSRDEYLYKELLPLEKKFDNIFLARDRYRTIWGGSSLLRMLLHSIKQLLASQDWHYIINLSESDFNIKPLNKLEKYLASNYGAIFLKSHALDNLKFIKKQGLDKTFYECEDRMWRLGDRDLPDGIIYTGGSDWFALPRYFCSYVDTDKDLVAPLLEFFNQTLLPAESFFHTVALNSIYCHSIKGNNLRISNWKRKQGCRCQHKDVVDWCGCSPLVYKQKDWLKLRHTMNQDIFFSRKFDPTISLEIINSVDEHLIARHTLDKSRTEDESKYSYWENLFDESDLTGRFDHKTTLMRNFATLALASAHMIDLSQNQSDYGEPFKLKSVDLFFSRDTFTGYIITVSIENVAQTNQSSVQLFVVRHGQDNIVHYNRECFHKLAPRVMEVSSDFDVKERIFKNYGAILGTHSDIILYHSWHIKLRYPNDNVGQQQQQPSNLSDTKIRFKWVNPGGMKEQILDVGIKPKLRSNNFAQALQVKFAKPLVSGQWTVRLYDGSNEHCLDYNFLILPDIEEPVNKLSFLMSAFETYYRVMDTCLMSGSHQDDREESLIDKKIGSHWLSNYCQASWWSTLSEDPKSQLDVHFVK